MPVLDYSLQINVCDTEYTGRQRQLSDVYSIMMEKLAQPSEGLLHRKLQLSGQIHSPYFISITTCTLWFVTNAADLLLDPGGGGRGPF